MRYAIYRKDCGMYLETPFCIWTTDKSLALTGTQGAMSAVAEDAFDLKSGERIEVELVECDPVAQVRAVINNPELCAEAMVAEVGEIVGEE